MNRKTPAPPSDSGVVPVFPSTNAQRVCAEPCSKNKPSGIANALRCAYSDIAFDRCGLIDCPGLLAQGGHTRRSRFGLGALDRC